MTFGSLNISNGALLTHNGPGLTLVFTESAAAGVGDDGERVLLQNGGAIELGDADALGNASLTLGNSARVGTTADFSGASLRIRDVRSSASVGSTFTG
jgi:hypothetical protein